jgi:hypothetical protein
MPHTSPLNRRAANKSRARHAFFFCFLVVVGSILMVLKKTQNRFA